MLNHRSSDLGIPAVSQHLSGLVLHDAALVFDEAQRSGMPGLPDGRIFRR
jgi:hypothetical protein